MGTIRLPPGRGRLWSWTLDLSLFAILRKSKLALRSREGGHRSTGASSLIEKSFVVCLRRHQSRRLATARVKACVRLFPIAEFGVRAESKCPGKQPVESNDEVVSSDLTRSTKFVEHLPPAPVRNAPYGIRRRTPAISQPSGTECGCRSAAPFALRRAPCDASTPKRLVRQDRVPRFERPH